MKILQYCPCNSLLPSPPPSTSTSTSTSTSPPKPRFGSNYERIGSRDRIHGH